MIGRTIRAILVSLNCDVCEKSDKDADVMVSQSLSLNGRDIGCGQYLDQGSDQPVEIKFEPSSDF